MSEIWPATRSMIAGPSPLNQPDLREKLARQGLFVNTSTPGAITSLMQTETAKWAKVVKAAGIKLE